MMIFSNGRYHGDSDLQLERINVYYNEARRLWTRAVFRRPLATLGWFVLGFIDGDSSKSLFQDCTRFNTIYIISYHFAGFEDHISDRQKFSEF